MQSNSVKSIHEWIGLTYFSGFVCITSHIYCTHEGSFPMYTFFRKKDILRILQILLQMRSFHFHSVYYSKDNEAHSSVWRRLGKLELRGVSSPETTVKSLHRYFQNLLILTIFLWTNWSNSDDWQDIAVCAKWSIIRHMARWEHPEFLPWCHFFIAPK